MEWKQKEDPKGSVVSCRVAPRDKDEEEKRTTDNLLGKSREERECREHSSSPLGFRQALNGPADHNTGR